MGLRPGVMVQPGGSPWTQSTNNIRPDETVWMMDGVINVNFYDARPIGNAPSPFTDAATIVPIDAIQEFNTRGKSQSGVRLEARRRGERGNPIGNQHSSRLGLRVWPRCRLGRPQYFQPGAGSGWNLHPGPSLSVR